MPRTRMPRSGTMAVWPRKRARRQYNRVRTWPVGEKALPLGFAGYKAGMTTVFAIDNRKASLTKGEEIAVPATILECPPLKIASVRLYKKTGTGLKLATEIFGKVNKELKRKVPIPKKESGKRLESIKPEEFDEVRLNVYTQPSLTGIGKKKPELFEMGIGGDTTGQKLGYARENLGKEIFIKDVLSEGKLIDIHAVTKGKGYQGPVKRHGIGLKHHKSEKGVRRLGTLGGWKSQGHFMYRVAHAGQTGYHSRIDYNKLVMKLGDTPEEVNPKGGFLHYGVVKNSYIIVKGSVAGPRKRLIRFKLAARPTKRAAVEAPRITSISLESKQGR